MINTEDGSKIYLEHRGERTPAVIEGPTEARLVDIDAVGKHHERKNKKSI